MHQYENTSDRTSEGYCAALWQSEKLAGLTLPHGEKGEAIATLGRYVGEELRSLPIGMNLGLYQQQLASDMVDYFNGVSVAFNVQLCWDRLTDFQRSVLEVVSRIPYGSFLSYGNIAKEIGKPKGARAVGGAVGSNPWLLVVPCHRVLASNGGLGGFSSGLSWKRRLLKIESIKYSG
ncbi:hypothetical protein N752_23045 [Desulforamulus aquiferis]|nr:hypothetical protein N752_23045 [Desulforamulus aquiferis]